MGPSPMVKRAPAGFEPGPTCHGGLDSVDKTTEPRGPLGFLRLGNRSRSVSPRATPAGPCPFLPRVPKSLYQTLRAFGPMLRVEDKKRIISSCALVVLRTNRDFELPFSPQPARYNENAWSHFVHKPAQNQVFYKLMHHHKTTTEVRGFLQVTFYLRLFYMRTIFFHSYDSYGQLP